MNWLRRFGGLLLRGMVVRVAAVALTFGLLYSLVLLERAVLSLVSEQAARYYRESSFLGPAIGIPLFLLILVGMVLGTDRLEKWLARKRTDRRS